MIKIRNQESNQELERNLFIVISEYLQRGFGSYTKNDFEVAIFYALLKSGVVGDNNYSISRNLGIPESKVKKLRYESDLRFNRSNNYTEIKLKELDKLLTSVVYKKDGERIQFCIEDPSLRKFLDNLLKTENSFSDSSFNSEIVSISLNDLPIIYSHLSGGKEMLEKVEEIYKIEYSKREGGKHKTIKQIWPEMALELAKTASNVTQMAATTFDFSIGSLLTQALKLYDYMKSRNKTD